MDSEREPWILERLVLLHRSLSTDVEQSRQESELFFHYARHIGPEAARRHLDRRIRETRVQLVKRFAGDPKAPLTPEPGSRNRGGRKANVTPLVEQKMRAMAPEELAAMKNEGMKETFNASITVVRAARNEVLVGKNRRARLWRRRCSPSTRRAPSWAPGGRTSTRRSQTDGCAPSKTARIHG